MYAHIIASHITSSHLKDVLGGVLIIYGHAHRKEGGATKYLVKYEACIVDVPTGLVDLIEKTPPTWGNENTSCV